MSSVTPGRDTADFNQPLVIFVIGMRINHFHKIGKWLPVALAMRPTIAELSRNPASGSRNKARSRMKASRAG